MYQTIVQTLGEKVPQTPNLWMLQRKLTLQCRRKLTSDVNEIFDAELLAVDGIDSIFRNVLFDKPFLKN